MADLRLRIKLLTTKQTNDGPMPFSSLGGQELAVALNESIPINYQEQKETEWCWATCAAMVGEYCKKIPFKQCRFASQLHRLSCCNDVLTKGCNRPCVVSDVKQVYEEIAVSSIFVDRALSFYEIEAEIGKRRPVEVGIAWNAGSGHVLMVINASRLDGREYVDIADPWPSSKGGKTGSVLYSELLNAFGRGKWRWSWIGIE